MSWLVAATVELPWPLVWLLALASLLVLVSGSYVIIRGAGTKERITMLQGERDDWKKAKQDGDEILADERKKHEARVTELVRQGTAAEEKCSREMAVLTSKVNVLENLVTGTSAVKEMAELLLAAAEHQHQEILSGLKAMDGSIRTFADAVWAMLGDGDRRRELPGDAT